MPCSAQFPACCQKSIVSRELSRGKHMCMVLYLYSTHLTFTHGFVFAGCCVMQDGLLQLVFEFPTPLYAEDAIASHASQRLLVGFCSPHALDGIWNNT